MIFVGGVKMKKRITITLSDQSMELIDKYMELTGGSRSSSIDIWLREAYASSIQIIDDLLEAKRGGHPYGNNGGHDCRNQSLMPNGGKNDKK